MGHRFLARGAVPILDAARYLPALEEVNVIADREQRQGRLAQQVESLAREAGGRIVHDPELMAINSDLLEWPTAFSGRFDPHDLELPREVIVTALREHQRFFAVESAEGKLLPFFIAARNGDGRGLDVVRRGNQDVLVARLGDARFYWEADLKHPPAARVDSMVAEYRSMCRCCSITIRTTPLPARRTP